MKIIPVFAALSVTANAVLLGALLRQATSDPAPASDARGTSAAPVAARAGAPLTPAVWAGLESSDLSEQTERLRAAGFPATTIRAIISGQVRAQFASRRQALEAADANRPYWDRSIDPQAQQEMAALGLEEQRAVRAVLGPDVENGHAARLRRLLPDLAAEKLAAIAQIRDRYDEKRFETSTRSLLPAEQAAQAQENERAMLAEIAATLTPQELEDYELRESRTATQLRNSLAAFEATEEEYRMLFRLRRAFDDQFGNISPSSDQATMRARSDAQRKLNEDMIAALGPERGAEYQRSSDSNYRRTLQLAGRLNLPPTTANDIYALQQAVQQRATEARRAPPAERNAQLAALAAEAEGQLTAKLGPDGLAAYKEFVGASWLTSLTPRPALPPAGTRTEAVERVR